MTTYFSEEIYDNPFFDVIKRNDAIIINLKKKNNILISSWLNGGVLSNFDAVVNQSIGGADYDLMLDGDYENFQKFKFEKLNLNPLKTAGLMTSACMDNYSLSTKKYEQLEVTSIVTAGADKNGIKAGDAASFYEYNNHYFNHFGTINIITIINANLNDGALITASITATEAKTSVLQDLKVESQYSNNIATGTGTDGICIISNKSNGNHIENAGKHSKLGQLIAESVQEALYEALYLQTFMSADFQNTVLSRLSRFNITYEDFYKSSDFVNKLQYASKFYYFNKNKQNVAFISMIVNLIDELQVGLLRIDDIEKIIKLIINSYLGFDVSNEKIIKIKDILDLLVKSINNYLI